MKLSEFCSIERRFRFRAAVVDAFAAYAIQKLKKLTVRIASALFPTCPLASHFSIVPEGVQCSRSGLVVHRRQIAL